MSKTVKKVCRYCGESNCPRRHNIECQEAVVEALWNFAANIQLRPKKGCMATPCKGERHAGVKLSLDHVGEALSEIMKTFNYGVLPI